MTCDEIFANMEDRAREMGVKDIYGVFQFQIDGDGGGHWHAICEGDAVRVQQGVFPKPDVTVITSARNAVKLAEGHLNPALALLTRKVKLKGDLSLAARVQSLLSK